jgi:predicted DNA binding CopG/RHH family protein
MKKTIPKFKTEVEERKFWQKNDSSGYNDWADAEEIVLPRLKPSTGKISIRLPESMIEELKLLANKRDVPYLSLLKYSFLNELIMNYITNEESSRTTQFTECKRSRHF